MSGAGTVDYPDELKLAHWEKRKLNLPEKSEVVGLLKSLQKSHGAVPWSRFDPGWVKSVKTAAELDEALENRQREWQGSVVALKKDAKALAAAALKLGKDKAFQDAGKAIDSAVDRFCAAIDDGLRELTQLADKARSGLASSDDGEDDEQGPAWMEPKRLLQQLMLCRKDPERSIQFAFVDKTDKTAGVLVMSPKQTGRSMFAKLQKETGVKTGAYGTAWMDGTELMLQLDKPLSGLVKKLRDPVKACGFRVSKIVLWNADGTVFESEAEDAGDTGDTGAPSPTPGGQDAGPDLAAAFNARLKALLPRVQAAAPQVAAELKPLLGEAGLQARQKAFEQAHALLDQAEARLDPAAPSPAPQAAAAPTVVFTQSRLAWDKTRKLVQNELRKLELAVLDQCRDEPDYAVIAGNTQALYQVLEVLDERLIDKFDEALNATLESDRRARQDEAREIVDEYMDYIRSDEFLHAVDDNGFVDVAIVSSLTACLTTVGKQLRS